MTRVVVRAVFLLVVVIVGMVAIAYVPLAVAGLLIVGAVTR